jgi:drug/metabolite transporter (DMT)-like permease
VTVSVVLALLAATANAGSNVLQRRANREEPPEKNLSLSLVWDLLHRRTWAFGITLVAGSFFLQAGALATGELAEVQPIIVLELPLTMVAGRLFIGSELNAKEWGSIALLTAGLAGLVGFLHPSGGSSRASTLGWLAGGAATVAVIAALVLAGRLRAAEVRGGLLGAAAGVAFGLTAAFMKAMTGELSRGFGNAVTSWPLYAMVVTGALGMFLVQSALQAGKLVASQPGISLLDPFTAIAWGVTVFHEHTSGGVFLVLAGACAAMMAVGAVLLSSYQEG